MNLVPLLLLGLSASVFAVNELVYPENCKDDDSCTYKAYWTVTKDQVKFTIVTKQDITAWGGIGFAKEKPMEKAEILYGYINSEGKPATFDGFIEDPDSAPVKDPLQKLIWSKVEYSNGYLTLNFVHHRVTNAPYEYSFRNTDCYYFILPIEGGSIVDDHGIINKPYNTPKITDDKICFHEDGLTTLGNPGPIVDKTTMLPETTTASYTYVCTKEGKDGLYPFPGNCNWYISCKGGHATILICPPEKPYFDPLIHACNSKDYLSADRKKECYIP